MTYEKPISIEDRLELDNILPASIRKIEDHTDSNCIIFYVEPQEGEPIHAGRILARAVNMKISQFPYPTSTWEDESKIWDARLDSAQFSYIEKQGEDESIKCMFMYRNEKGNFPVFIKYRDATLQILGEAISNKEGHEELTEQIDRITEK